MKCIVEYEIDVCIAKTYLCKDRVVDGDRAHGGTSLKRGRFPNLRGLRDSRLANRCQYLTNEIAAVIFKPHCTVVRSQKSSVVHRF